MRRFPVSNFNWHRSCSADQGVNTIAFSSVSVGMDDAVEASRSESGIGVGRGSGYSSSQAAQGLLEAESYSGTLDLMSRCIHESVSGGYSRAR